MRSCFLGLFALSMFFVACDDTTSISNSDTESRVDTLYVSSRDTVYSVSRDTIYSVDTLVLRDTIYSFIEKDESCKIEDKGVSIQVTCGEKNTVLYKATCGDVAFDPEKAFCNGGRLIRYDALDTCGTIPFDTLAEFCFNDVKPFPFCAGKKYDGEKQGCKDGEILSVCGGSLYDPAIKICSDEKILEKCGDAGYDPEYQECYDSGVGLKCSEVLNTTPNCSSCSEGKCTSCKAGTHFSLDGKKCEHDSVYDCGESHINCGKRMAPFGYAEVACVAGRCVGTSCAVGYRLSDEQCIISDE